MSSPVKILNGFVSTTALPTQVQVEYVWLDANSELKSNIRTLSGPMDRIEHVPAWSLDDGTVLVPENFVRGSGSTIVMCSARGQPTTQVQTPEDAGANKLFSFLTGEDFFMDMLAPPSPSGSQDCELLPVIFDGDVDYLLSGLPADSNSGDLSSDPDFSLVHQTEQGLTAKADWRSLQMAAHHCERQGRPVEAIEHYLLCWQALDEGSGRALQTQIEVSEKLGMLFQTVKQNERALEFYGKAMSLKQRSKVFPCPHCPYTAFHKGNLAFHIRTHTGEKPFQCSECSYSAARRCHLNVHMRTHSGDKPFPCELCNYSAKTKSQLQGHMRTHTRETPFKCPSCPYAASQQGTLSRHIHRKHQNPESATDTASNSGSP